jgi:hypothetical protein
MGGRTKIAKRLQYPSAYALRQGLMNTDSGDERGSQANKMIAILNSTTANS